MNKILKNIKNRPLNFNYFYKNKLPIINENRSTIHKEYIHDYQISTDNFQKFYKIIYKI